MSKLYIGQNNIAIPVKTAYYGINNKAVKVWEAEEPTPPTPGGEIYGAEWDGSSNPQWTRTDAATNFQDPVPAVNNGTGSSPFDDIMPWAGMIRSTDANAGEIVAIPKFYYKLSYHTETIGLKIQISMTQHEDFYCSPAHMDKGDGAGERDVVYIGRYKCSDQTYKSLSNVQPQVNVRKVDFRVYIHNLGNTIWQWDYSLLFTLWLLYLVEFANWDEQRMIGYGGGQNSIVNNGSTDLMQYHTGTSLISKDLYGSGIQYRNIEGLWENTWDYLDGCCVYNKTGTQKIGFYTIQNPNDFSSDYYKGTPTYELPLYTNGTPSKFSINDLAGYPIFYPIETIDDYPNYSIYSCDSINIQTRNALEDIHMGTYYGLQNLSYGFFTLYSLQDQRARSISSRLMILP